MDDPVTLVTLSKREARAAGRAARRAMSDSARADASAMICAQIIASGWYRSAATLSLYFALPDEVDVSAVQAAAERDGKRIVVPVIVGEGLMEMAVFCSGDPLVADRFGIPTPADVQVVAASDVDVSLVPLSAVDRSGKRVGGGKGYYDRWLARTSTLRVAVAFDVQVLDALDADPWDEPMHVIVTESHAVDLRDLGSGGSVPVEAGDE